MDNRINKKDEEINKAILEWLINKNYTNSVETFLSETNMKKEDASKGNSLDKKWGTILILQKKITDYEAQIKQLKEEIQNGGGGGSANGVVKRENESMGIPRAPAKASIKGHRGSITCIIFHPVYNLLVSGAEDASIMVWECEEFTKEKSIKAHSNTVNALTFDYTGKYLASCSADLTIKIWNFDTMTCFKTLTGHDHTVSSVEFTNDGNFLFSASRDKTIKFWEVSTGNNKKTFTGHLEWVRCLSLNSQGNLLASSADDEIIIIWNVENGAQLYTLTGHENKIEAVVFVKNQLAVANIFNSDYSQSFTQSMISDTPENDDSNKNKELNSNSTYTTNDNYNSLVDLNKKLLEKSKVSAQKDQKINKEYVISASRDKTIKIWDVFGSSCIFNFNGHDNWVRAIVVHPNGKYLVSSSDDKSIRIWELKTGRCSKKLLDAHDKFVVSLAFTHKYSFLASGSNDQAIKIWDCK
jgi:platelet-activating factor acetylhydrolase IB subunit alpha